MATTPRSRAKPARQNGTGPAAETARRHSQINLSEVAYERIEEMLVCCALPPGRFLATHELQAAVGYGRTPVLQAVNRLAADTLVIVTPRHGLQIAPVNLSRERVLLRLRRDMERFVIRLATERSGASERNQMLHLKRQLVEHRDVMNLDQFNLIDRRIDQLFLTAAGEPFVESTLRPLHTLFRRIGWIYHMQTQRGVQLQDTIDAHAAVIDAVAAGQAEAAIAASDHLMSFVDGMFDAIEREVAPSMLDCSLGGFDVSFSSSATAAAA